MKNLICYIAVIFVCELTISAQAATIAYIADATGDRLLQIDLTNARVTSVGSFVALANTMSGLAYDPTKNVLYGTNAPEGSIYTINRKSGLATRITPPVPNLSFVPQGLTFDSNANSLLLTTPVARQLHSFSIATGVFSLIGSTGNIEISGLAYDPIGDVLYGATASQLAPGKESGFFRINKTTGATQRIGTSQLGYNGLAFDPISGQVYGVRNTEDALYRINPQTGVGTRIGEFLGGLGQTNPLGLEIIVIPEPNSIVVALIALGAIGLFRRRLLDGRIAGYPAR